MKQNKLYKLIFLAVLTMLSCNLVTYRNDPNLEDNTSKYIVNFPDHLGDEWRWMGTVHSREDIEGFSPSIVDTTSSSTIYNGHPNAFIAHYVTKLEDEDAAQGRFDQISEFIRRVLSPGYFDIGPSLQASGADQQLVICSTLIEGESVEDLQCEGVFRFASYIVFVNVRAVVEGVQYLTDEEIIEVFNLAVEPIKLDLGRGNP